MDFFYLIIALYSILLAVLAWYRFNYAVGVFIFVLPSYLIRFYIGPFPSTILEVSFGVIFLVWCLKYFKEDILVIKKEIREHKIFFVFLGLFLVASVLGIWVSDEVWKSTGQWRAYFLEPLIVFFILLGRKKALRPQELIWYLIVSTLSISMYAIIQRFTGWGIATPEWTKAETRRATAFFSSPNAVGLYLGPIVILIFALLFRYLNSRFGIFKERIERLLLFLLPLKKYLTRVHYKKRIQKFFGDKKILFLSFVGTGALLAIVFTKSEGTVLALGAGMLVVLFFLGFRKFVLITFVVGLIVCFTIPTLRSAVLFKDKPGQNRLTLWSYSWNYLTESPKNFILGAGVRQFFRKVQKPYYDVKKMERLTYPHNIILNFWTEIGLLGIVSFLGILGYLLYLAKRIMRRDIIYGAGLVGVAVVLIVHGLVDVPYFKNDLAMLFWIITSLFFASFDFIE